MRVDYAFFTSPGAMFSRTGYILELETQLNKFKKIEIKKSIYFEQKN